MLEGGEESWLAGSVEGDEILGRGDIAFFARLKVEDIWLGGREKEAIWSNRVEVEDF